ncbi:hypothetical protein VMA_000916 [Vibrio mimicus VM223]|nr:hypothetical protein VMA_000916 [Vibrio mimicus VM223]
MTAIKLTTRICVSMDCPCTVPRAITMISADRIKSVRIAPPILRFSYSATLSVAKLSASKPSVIIAAARCSASCLGTGCSHFSRIFSAPSKQRNRPPSSSKGMINQGAMELMMSAAGTKISLLRNEPLATAHTTGISRSAATPETCCALSAKSSPSTPAVFFAAIFDITATSSSTVAISSSRVNKLAPAIHLLSYSWLKS